MLGGDPANCSLRASQGGDALDRADDSKSGDVKSSGH